MEISIEQFNELISGILHDSDILSEDIPDIDLYIDQIVSIFERKLGPNKAREGDKTLTKTMVNNYSKEGLINSLKGKKYSKEHILQIVFIFYLKQILSIQEIKKVMNGVSEEIAVSNKRESLEQINDRYLAIKEHVRNEVPNVILTIFKDHDLVIESLEDILLVLLSLAGLSNYINRIAINLVDNFFVDVEEKQCKDKKPNKAEKIEKSEKLDKHEKQEKSE